MGMSAIALILFGIWCMIVVLILEVRKLNKTLDSSLRDMYIKSIVDDMNVNED